MRANFTRLLGFLSEGNKEFVRGDSGLLEDAGKSANLYLAVVWNDAPGGASTHDNVTASLA